jgi:serine/threonine-protein kinase
VTSTVPLIDRVRAALGQDFEILRLLGQGGMATVYLARERALKRLVAIKVLDPDLAASRLFRN